MGGLLPSRLQGRRLVQGAYEPLPAVPSPDGTLLLSSETLGLDLLADRSGKLRFRDPVTGDLLLSPEELEAARQREATARQRAEARVAEEAAARQREEAARRAAEARVAELEALLGLRRG